MDRKWLTFLIVAVPTVLLAWSIPSIEIYSRFTDLLPAKHEFVINYERMKDTFGGANLVAMSLEVVDPAADVFTTGTLRKLRYLTEQVDLIHGANHYQVASLAHPKIRRVRTDETGLIHSDPVLPRELPTAAAALKRLREEAFNNDIVYGTYLSTDGRAALIVAGFDEDRLDYREIHARLQALKREVEADGTTRLYIAGEPVLKGWIYHHAHELRHIFGVTLATMVLLLWLHFRSLSGVAVPMLGTALSAAWGLGFIGRMGFNLDPLMLVVPILISARTASHCVQMMERYFDEIRLGRDREAAVRVSMGELLVPASIAIFTDAAGLLVLAVSSIPAIAKMGYFCAVWSASNLLTVAVLVPLVMSVLPTPRLATAARAAPLPARAMHRLGLALAGPRATRATLFATLLLAGWSLYHGWAPPIGDSRPGSPILFPDSEHNVAAAHIARRFAGVNQLAIYFETEREHGIKRPEVVALMEALARHMAQTPSFGGTRDIPQLVRAINRLYHYDDPRWALLPPTQNGIGNTLFMYEAGAAVPGVILEYMDLKGTRANFVVFYKDATGRTLAEAARAAREFIATHRVPGVTMSLAGGIVGTTVAANEEVAASDLRMTGLIVALVMLSVVLAYESLLAGALVFVVLGLAVMINRAFMALHGIGLNVNTLPVTSVGVGLGVDYAIYMLDRIREEVKHRTLDDAIVVAMRTTGAAVLLTALMVVAGIVYWIPGSSLRFNSEMALLLCMLLTTNMLGAVTLIPVLVRVLQPAFILGARIDTARTGADRARDDPWPLAPGED